MSETRVLRFPTDRSAGLLIVVVDTDKQQLDARGDVEVPADAQVALEMGHGDDARPGDVAALELLAPDDLVHVGFRDVPTGSLSAVGRLTGLTGAVLGGAIGDDDLAELSGLESLGMLILISDSLVGTGLKSLTQPSLETLYVMGSGLTAQALAVAAGLDVKELSLQLGVVTAEDLDAIAAVGVRSLSLRCQEVDSDALTRLIARSPSLRSINAYAADQPAFDERAVLALRSTNPDLTINGVWYDAAAVRHLVASDLTEVDLADAEPAEPLELTTDTFDSVIAGSTPVLVDFTAVWCGPCKALKPTIHELTGQLAGRLVVGELDIDNHREIAERYGIKAIPALLVFKGGEQVARIGSQQKDEILAQLAPVLN